MKIKLQDIMADPDQPRKTFNEDKIKELRDSLDGLGLIQPITVRPHEGKYMVIVGERRYRAACLDGLTEVECLIREDVDDKAAREMQFTENAHQEDISPYEAGMGYQKYLKEFKVTSAELCRRTGLNRGHVNERLAIVAKLDGSVAAKLHDGTLEFTEARELAKIDDPRRQEEVAKVFTGGKIHSSHAAEIVQIAKEQPDRPDKIP